MKSEARYTLGEAFGVLFGISFLAFIALPVVMFPLMLLSAWIRMTAWNWFCVYVHLPQIGIWMMLAISMFVSLFTPRFPSIKQEYLQSSYWQRLLFELVSEFIALGMLWCIHHWILK